MFNRIVKKSELLHDAPSHLTLDPKRCELAKSEAMQSQSFGNLTYSEAFPVWLDGRKKLKEESRKYYREYFKAAAPYFGAMRLCEIDIGHIREYQVQRQAAIRAHHQLARADWKESDGAARVNHEINTLSQVMRPPGLWEEIAKYYEPLPLPREGPGMALTEQEEAHLFKIARTRPRWLVAYCAGLLSRNTTAGPKEIRCLRLKNIDLDRRLILVEETEHGIKNQFRVRPLPLNNDARAAARWLVDRYREAMAKAGVVPDPNHYVLFHRAHVLGAAPDPSRPMGSWKKAHYAMRAEAAKEFPRLARARRYDYRHTACTRLLEDPSVSYSTIEKMMGHRLGSKTKRIYDHVRDATLRAAASVLDAGHAKDREAAHKPPAGVVSIAAKAAAGTAVGLVVTIAPLLSLAG